MKKLRSPHAVILYPVIFILLSLCAYLGFLWGSSMIIVVMLFLQPFVYVIASEFSLNFPFVRGEGDRIGALVVVYLGMNLLISIFYGMFFTFVPPVPVPEVAPMPVLPLYSAPTPFILPTRMPTPTPDPSVRCLGQCKGDGPNSSYDGGHACIGMDDLCYFCGNTGQFRVVPDACGTSIPLWNRSIDGTISSMPWNEQLKRRSILIDTADGVYETHVTDTTFMSYQGYRVYLDAFTPGDFVIAIIDQEHGLVNISKQDTY